MSRQPRSVSERVLSRLDVRRRDFIKGLIAGTTFVTPVLTSLSLGSPSLEPRTAHAQGTRGLEIEAIGDSVLRQDAPNTNEGATPRLRVSTGPAARAVVKFDPTVIRLFARRALSVSLVLDVASVNWGQGQSTGTDRTVSAHALSLDFTEGNGTGGPGVTWNTPEDLDISNTTLESVREPWKGGEFNPVPTAVVEHPDTLRGPVRFDVTADIRAGVARWLLKATTETGQNGGVEYLSRETDPAPDASLLGPRLVFTYFAGS